MTLLKEESVLPQFFQGESAVQDESGAYFIDRDPRYFRIILNYLRTGAIHLEDNASVEGLLEEARFYELTSMADRLAGMRTNAANFSSPATLVQKIQVCMKEHSCPRFGGMKAEISASDTALLPDIEATFAERNFSTSWPSEDTLRVDHIPYSTFLDVCTVLGQHGYALGGAMQYRDYFLFFTKSVLSAH